MRVFIGIPLPDQYQEMLGSIKKEWDGRFKSKLIWTKPGNWHLTVKFLGEVEQTRLPVLAEFMQEMTFDNFTLKGSGGGFFGLKGMYRVAWLGLGQDVHALISLADRIDEDLSVLGFEKNVRPFKGHLTLARIKNFHKNDPWNELTDYVSNLAWPAFKVDQVNLWQSFLSQTGPRYEILSRAVPV
ncbi:MAG: RNA 2',3'-cyclic phosphodiesterase [Desulfonatronovibrio sp.]